jgi:hypothetical protein
VVEQEPLTDSDPVSIAQRAADRLALALEDVGFDVGRTFPLLSGRLDREGAPVVDLGHVTASVASRLTAILSRVAGLPDHENEP